MSNSTTTKQKDILNTQSNADQTHKENSSKPLIERIPIDNTPFTLIGDQEKGYFIAMGNYKITDQILKNEEEANLMLKDKIYEIILNMIVIVDEKIEQMKKEESDKTYLEHRIANK